MNNGKKILYVGYNGFPLGFAQVERQKLIAKGLIACDCIVTIVSRYGSHPADKADAVTAAGTAEGIGYIYASGRPLREDSFLKRNFNKFKGLFNEIRLIRASKKANALDAIIITTNSFYNIFFYSTLAFFNRVPVILDNVEHWTSIKGGKKLPEKLDNYLYDNYGFACAQKVIGISDYLVNVVRTKSPGKPVTKIPAIVDFSKFGETQKAKPDVDFLLYCGSAIYYEVLYFVVEAFEKTENSGYWLYIVSNGNPWDMEKVKTRIQASPKSAQIKLFSGLPYSKLVELYMTARALLIPLRNTEQDIARFPHKIGEYCAAGKTIISTETGEIKNYFSDQVNGLLAKEYDAGLFAEKMRFVVDHPDLADRMGEKAFETGKENFDHLVLGRKIYNFIFS